MPRIRYIEEHEKSDEAREMIASAERTGAPDPRVVSIMTRHPTAGMGWVRYWNALLYEGLLPHTLKELCRRWSPELAGAFMKDSTHRALDDIRGSIDELKYYRANFIASA